MGLCRGILRLRQRSLVDPENEPNLNLFPPMPQNYLGLDHLNVAYQRVPNHAIGPCAVHYGILLKSSEDTKKMLDVPPLCRGYKDDRDDMYSSSALSEIVQENKRVDVTNASLIERTYKQNS